ncbi:3',5'-cyclic AMP phosphodiesterase CpdA [Streptomyces sp. V4I23]|uniref:metallophosphoesterase family protein n=1 Tax=Streptomyces sp. V4I23 TaxID=3042282 RepID=UPI00278269EA|nr:metallophosphoesterase [Streptomyces sp. V4I23]MDQ1005686.1 3',5'-cyclic AMP phosphodiesterase CpdA [Streptomyces sp. V4I23]MDQ1005725.1 3',5'-cyclic AMP phosphodiesterase CpdA [Streptomyces sp. V4I23]
MAPANRLGISDLHVSHPENREIVENLRPTAADDWLLVAGDVGELTEDIEWVLSTLRDHFAKVVWATGNHEPWTPREDPVQLRGEERYRYLVDLCRGMDILTPEDPYAVWEVAGGPVTVAPLFVLYDYSLRTPTAVTKEAALEQAYEKGVVCTDEFFLHPDPYPSREAWCDARVRESERRLAACDPDLPTVLVNHYPLVRHPTRILYHPEFAQWSGTVRTADWHHRFRARSVVYGHLHIPRTTWHDGVCFEEVSVGYPREWRRPGHPRNVPRRVLPQTRTP